ncbi:hypothetical protein HN51_053949 [Arachis hypogaea]|uniref:Uncharacterized protein n=1 Tax=Arachis hypogaea TaxID=3818 RepID=A0A6B9V872_ARAHY|nr:uncharacterized protein LOC112777236 [Arachis hypogaea]QHN76382.1 uncharacterized protein DS421_19g643410 [Arachis hypogaea]
MIEQMTNPNAHFSLVFLAFLLSCQVFSDEHSEEKRIGTHNNMVLDELEGSTSVGSHDFQSRIPKIKTNYNNATHSFRYYPTANHAPPPPPPRRRRRDRAPNAIRRHRLRPRPLPEIDPLFPWIPQPKALPPLPRPPSMPSHHHE